MAANSDVRNMALNTVGETVWGFKTGLVASVTVLTVLLRDHGASERLIGVVGGLETGAMLIPQLLGARLFASRRRRRVHMILWHVLVILPFLLAMGVLTLHAPRLAPAVYRWLMVAGHSGFCLAIGVANAAWIDFVAHLVSMRRRGTAMGLALAGSAFAGTGGSLAAGWAIGRFSGTRPFAAMYMGAWLLGTLAMTLWLPVDDRALRVDAGPDRLPFLQLLARFKASVSEGNFRAYLIGRILAALGFCILPFIALHYRSDAGGALPASVVVACGAALTFGTACGSLLLGRLGDRAGHRWGMLVGAGTQIGTLLVLLLVSGVNGCVVAYGAAGVCVACGQVSHYNMILETCPHEHHVAHISVGNLIVGVPMLLAPVAAGFIAGHIGLRAVFGACLVPSAAALLWFVVKVKEPRTLPVIQARTG